MIRTFFLFTFLLAAVLAQADPVFVTEAGAIRGYDPVAYHTDKKAVRGREDLMYEWQGAQWHFASEQNRDLFAADPGVYAPKYGGFCAFGTSRGYQVSTDPQAFTIVDGTLYLNYSPAVMNTWNQDQPGYIRAADREWPALIDKPYEPE
jgi:hypothetical protein